MTSPAAGDSSSDALEYEHWFDEACDRFESAWKAGSKPRIEDYLDGQSPAAEPSHRAALLRELVLIDLAYRWRSARRQSSESSPSNETTAPDETSRPSSFPSRPLLEDYAARLRQLGPSQDLPIELIKQEYRIRCQCGDRPSPAECATRFSGRADVVQALQKLDELEPKPPRQALRLNCPHCHNPIEVVVDDEQEIHCPSCGSTFRPDNEQTRTWNKDNLPRLGKFELLVRLGFGAFGTVYKAYDSELKRTVALKLPRSGTMVDQEDEDRFLREARSAAQLRHPGIVPIFEVGRSQKFVYIVSELVDGITLADALTAKQFGFRESAELVERVAQALDHSHRHGVVHRDLKPSNIMLNQYGGPRIMDFGLAKRETDEVTMTIEGQVLGTPAYMSPEQASGKTNVDGRTDIYSLGVILYELLTHELPFRGNQRMLLHQVINDEPRSPRSLNDRIPRDLETICLKAMAKEPERRYESAAKFAADLTHYLSGQPTLARPVGRVERVWRWCKRKPVSAGLLMALVAGTVGTSWQWFRAEDNAASARANEQTADVKRREAEKNLKRALAAEKGLKEQLWQSFVDQGRARIYSGQPGQRHKALEALREGARIRSSPELRDLAIAALARTDIRLGKQWAGFPDPHGPEFLVFDVDLEWYARADRNGVQVRRVADDQLLFSLSDPAYKNMAFILRFSADRKYLAVACGWPPERYLHIWDLERADEPVLKQHIHSNAFDFTPDSHQVAVARSDGSISLYELATGALVRTLDKGQAPSELVISPDGRRLAVSQTFGSQVQVRDIVSGDVQVTVVHPDRVVYDLAWHPHDPNLLATSCWGIHLWDLRSPEKPIATLPGQAGPTTNIAFSHGGDVLASKGWGDTTVRLWDTWTGRQLVQIPGTSANGEIPLQFSRDDRRLAFYQSVTEIGLWEVELAREFRSLASHAQLGQGNYPSLDMSADGWLLAAPSRYGPDDGIRLWEVDTGRELAFLPVGTTYAVRFHPRGKDLFSAHEAGLYHWPIRGGQEAVHLGPPRRIGPADRAHHFSISADGRRLAVSYAKHGVMVFPVPSAVVGVSGSVPSSDPRPSLTEPGEQGVTLVGGGVNEVALSSDGRWLAATMPHGKGVMVFDVETRKHAKTLPARLYSRAEFSADLDGKWLVTSAADEYCIYEVGTWERRHRLPRTAGGDGGGYVAFSPDGKVLAAAPTGLTVQLIDPATARVLATLEPSEPDRNLPGALRFSPDGSQLAVCTIELRVLHVWDLRLVGQRLAELGQDWELPAFSAPARGERKPLKVKVNLGAIAVRQHLQKSRDHLRALDWQRAFDEAIKAVELSKEDAEAWCLRAQARMALKQYELAVADFQQALKLGMQDTLALNNVAWRLVVTPDAPPNLVGYAVDWAKAAVDQQPTQAFYWNTLGVAHYRAGDFKATIEALANAEELQPDTAFAFNAFFLAMAHWQLDQPNQARQWFDRAAAWMMRKETELQNNPAWQDELRRFRTEAERLMGVEATTN